MKKLLSLMLVGLLIFTGCGAVEKVSEFTELVEEVDSSLDDFGEMVEDVEAEVNEKVEEATKEAEKLVEEAEAAKDETIEEADTDDSEDTEDVAQEEGLRDTSNAILIEEARIYEGTIEAGGQIEYLVEAGPADHFNVLVKANGPLIGQFKEVKEDENANNGFNIYSDKGIFKKVCDQSELFYLKNDTDGAVDYAFVGLIGSEEDLKSVINETGGLVLPSETVGGFDQATFLVGDTGIYINGVKAYAENVEMGYPMYDGRMYLEFAGTMNNNGAEEITFTDNVRVQVFNIYGEMMTNAEKWLEDANTKVKVAVGSSVEFKQLFLMDMVGERITVVISNQDTGAANTFIVEVGAMTSEVAQEQEAAVDATSEVILLMTEDIVTAFAENNYGDIANYGDFVTMSSIFEGAYPTSGRDMEDYMWEASLSDETVYGFGVLEDGTMIEMTSVQFIDAYINELGYQGMTPEIIKTSRDGEQAFEWINPAYTNYYAKYSSGDHELYFQYEEVYTDEFALIGIRVK